MSGIVSDVYEPYFSFGGVSILPTGELFRLYHITSSDALAPVTSSYLTDIKIFKQDEIYSKAYSSTTSSMSDVVWFTNF